VYKQTEIEKVFLKKEKRKKEFIKKTQLSPPNGHDQSVHGTPPPTS
jgi:hypothetical protein